MKKLIALLLVLCMVVGLVACGKGDGGKETTGATTGNNGGTTTTPTGENSANVESNTGVGKDVSNTGITSNDDLINPAFAGKTIQIYGFSSAAYDDISEMGYGNFIWMMRAAIDEWAALNNVTIVFEGDYDQNTVMGAINSGEKPDLLLHCDRFPIIASLGIVRSFTEEEYKQLSDICGEKYLDMLQYKGDSYGINYPWSGNNLFYYNKTMFEEYGVKTPKEYYMEDNWTWDTMVECFKEVTKDLDGDGKMDTYGSGTYGSIATPYTYKEDLETGELTFIGGTDEAYRKFLEIKYNGLNIDNYLGTHADCTIATNPRPATHNGDAEWYNYAHLNQTLVNGDVVETLPLPLYQADQPNRYVQFTQAFMSVFKTCDEPEATISLISYILRVGMRYMSDYSLGLFKCDYEGMRGTTDYSAGWKENFEWIVEERRAEFDAIEDWDQELYNKMIADIFADSTIHYIGKNYAGGQSITDAEIDKLPPASALPLITQKAEAWLATYNSMYVN